ncbi:hypothetical protein CI109_103209 [Kwoniella shandongensis]|uniref:DASH complex subunit SPC19 n=1 Tax=Kwoniella shandongensis TaxID=1734106 RepID=A0A5M6C8R6_9TREE|nr:uncharacterized protein CI109_000399 [Kwoniella shandongensis]KAA5531556.1 hypothetical protein CI109_000399 [Kwoniella shandongensis]
MAFASSSRHLPRESTYPVPPPSDFLNALEDCVQATEACTRTLQHGIDKLEPGTRDLPRLTKVMRHKHHFLVLPEPTISAHKSALATSLAPQIDQLISKAEHMVESEKAKVANLEERLRILESARLPSSQPQTTKSSLHSSTFSSLSSNDTNNKQEKDTSCQIVDLNMKDLSILQRKKVMALKQKRERLEREMTRLGV